MVEGGLGCRVKGRSDGSKRSEREKEGKGGGVRGGGRDLFSLVEEEDVINIEADAIITSHIKLVVPDRFDFDQPHAQGRDLVRSYIVCVLFLGLEFRSSR